MVCSFLEAFIARVDIDQDFGILVGKSDGSQSAEDFLGFFRVLIFYQNIAIISSVDMRNVGQRWSVDVEFPVPDGRKEVFLYPDGYFLTSFCVQCLDDDLGQIDIGWIEIFSPLLISRR